MAEVHDCFTPTELVLMEDLGLRRAGHGLEGSARRARSTSTASCRSTPTAASSRFGHPIGASGLRMLFECWLQLRGEAPAERQIDNGKKLGLTHNLGGAPGACVSFVSVVGAELG